MTREKAEQLADRVWEEEYGPPSTEAYPDETLKMDRPEMHM